MTDTKSLKVEAKGDLEIVITRDFNAPAGHVFDAWTKPELITKWLGVRGGWTFAVCEVDLKVGGAYRFVWRSSEGTEMGMGGIYREIDRPARLVSTERFDDPWYPGESVNTLELTERAGTTIVVATMKYESREVRDGVLASPMATGIAESYDKLAEILAKRAA
jgi:uncharacterized protein YndB with AHSA1/START domain